MITPSTALRDYVDIEVSTLDENADVYWNENDSAAIIADRVLIEVLPNPDADGDAYYTLRTPLRR